MKYPKDCPTHGRNCTKGDCPDYMAVWLRGACSSSDPLRSALVLVLDEFDRRVDRDPANPAPGQRKALHETARRAFNATAWADHDVLDMLDTAVSAVLDALAPPVGLPATLASVDDVAAVCEAAGLDGRERTGWGGLGVAPCVTAEPFGRWAVAMVETAAGQTIATVYRDSPASVLWHAIQAARSAS